MRRSRFSVEQIVAVLKLRSKLPRRRKMVVQRRQRVQPRQAGEAWTMDFVADQFGHGGKFRILTVVDVFTRQALAVEAGLRHVGVPPRWRLDQI